MARVKDRNRMKKMFLGPLQKYCQRLEAENAALKGDPDTVIGQFIGQMQELFSQNSKLSVLSAALIDRVRALEAPDPQVPGGTVPAGVTLSKEAMERFKDHQLVIKWDLPEGVEKAEDAAEYVFTYEAVAKPQPTP